MRKYSFFSILICISFVMLIYSCEKAYLQKSSKEETVLTPRTDDCDNCPIDDCCCAVELAGTSTSATLELCGTSSGIGLCSITPDPPSPCSPISGGGIHIVLGTGHTYEPFCMGKGNSFSIHNISGFPVTIKLSCQHDMVHPQTVTITIANGGYYYYVTNSSCEITECD
jgi:hypothetical protein